MDEVYQGYGLFFAGHFGAKPASRPGRTLAAHIGAKLVFASRPSPMYREKNNGAFWGESPKREAGVR